MVNAYYMNNLYQQAAAATPLSGPIPAGATATNFLSPTSLISPTYNHYQYPTASATNPMTAPLALLTNPAAIKVHAIHFSVQFYKSDGIHIFTRKTIKYFS